MTRNFGRIEILALALLVSCSHAKVKFEQKSLEQGALTKSTTIAVKDFDTSDITFKGDKAKDAARIQEEKQAIKSRLAKEIVSSLRAKGFKAALFDGKASAGSVIIEGKVMEFDHGSGAARVVVGFGAGSSNLLINVKVFSSNKTLLSDFDLGATSGGSSDPSAFVESHMRDAGKTIAEYFESRLK